jgi:phosphoserine phosphatase RsbU/P
MCQISMKIGMVTDLPVLMPKILDCLFNIYPGAERAAILLCTASGTDLEPVAVKTRGGQPEWQQELAVSRTIVNDVLHHQHAILSNDMLSDDRFKDQASVITHATRSIMCTPLLAEHHTLGLIQLDTHHGPDRFTEDDLERLFAII